MKKPYPASAGAPADLPLSSPAPQPRETIMPRIPSTAAAIVVFAALLTGEAAADGEILLTHAKALAGNVTPGDAPGYPISLTSPGTYQFAGAIHPSPESIGINVASEDITIDMNGFRMHGSNAAYHGITGAVDNVTIKNGTIQSFKFDAIHGTGRFWIIENMRIVKNGRDGVYCGLHSLIASSIISDNGGDGIQCTTGLVSGNHIAVNAGRGIQVGGTVVGNHISNNGGYGISGNGGINATGYANNTLYLNNIIAGPQINAATQMQPNSCNPACP
jgi:hypothetical protein